MTNLMKRVTPKSDFVSGIESLDIEYSLTNESLEAIIAGLSVQDDDSILAVGGSGDQILAMLEFTPRIVGVDYNQSQVEFMKRRFKHIKETGVDPLLQMYRGFGSRDGNINKSFNKFKLEQDLNDRLGYFRDERRRERIRKNLLEGSRDLVFDLVQGDLTNISSMEFLRSSRNLQLPFSKMYLSNALGYDSSGADVTESLRGLSLCLREGRLIYVANHMPLVLDFSTSSVEEIVTYSEGNRDLELLQHLPDTLRVDRELSLKARELEKRWTPAIYRRI